MAGDFDVEGARAAGYSESEIADHLGKQSGFDTGAAREAGYSDKELLAHLVKAPAPAPGPRMQRAPQTVQVPTEAGAMVDTPVQTGSVMDDFVDTRPPPAAKPKNERASRVAPVSQAGVETLRQQAPIAGNGALARAQTQDAATMARRGERVLSGKNLTQPNTREAIENARFQPLEEETPAITAKLGESVSAARPVASAAMGQTYADSARLVLDLDARLQSLEEREHEIAVSIANPEYDEFGGLVYRPSNKFPVPGRIGYPEELKLVSAEKAKIQAERDHYATMAEEYQRDQRLATPQGQGLLGKAVTSTAASAPPTLAALATGIVTKNPALAIAVGTGGGAAQQAAQTFGETLRDGEEAKRRLAEWAKAGNKAAYIAKVLADPDASDPFKTEAKRISDEIASINTRESLGSISPGAAHALRQRAAQKFEGTLQHVAKNATLASAKIGGFIDGVLEGAGEQLGLGVAMRPGSALFKRIINTAATEFGQEFATQLAQTLNKYLRYDPTITVRAALEDALVAGTSGIMMAGAAGPIGHVAQQSAQRAEAAAPFKELERSIAGASLKPGAAAETAHGAPLYPKRMSIDIQPPVSPSPGTPADLAAVMSDDRPLSEIRQEQAQGSAAGLAPLISEAAQNDAQAANEARQQAQGRAEALGVPAAGERAIARYPSGDVVPGVVDKIEFGPDGQPAVHFTADDGTKFIIDEESSMQLAPAPVGEGTPGAPVAGENKVAIAAAAARAERNPTPAQAAAGNYRKGHVDFQGLDVTIENPRGSTRRDMNNTPPRWQVEMQAHYGYVKRTVGADEENVDVYIGENPDSQKAFIVDQIRPSTGEFDEHKVMLGYTSEDAAKAAYKAHFNDGSGAQRMGAITELTIPHFKEWLKGGETKQAFKYVKPTEVSNAAPAGQKQSSGQQQYQGVPQGADVRENTGEVRQGEGGQAGGGGSAERAAQERGRQPAAAQGEAGAEGNAGQRAGRVPRKRLRGIDGENDSLLVAIGKYGGIDMRYRRDVTGDNKQIFIPGVGPLFRSNGRGLDELARLLTQDPPYMTQEEVDSRFDTDGIALLTSRIQEELAGRKFYSLRSERQNREAEQRVLDEAKRDAAREAEEKKEFKRFKEENPDAGKVGADVPFSAPQSAHEKAVRYAEASLRDAYKDQGITIELAAPSSSAEREIAGKTAAVFGKEVVFVKFSGVDANGLIVRHNVAGMPVPAKPVSRYIFISEASDHPALQIVGHELTHHLRADRPDLYKQLDAAVRKLLINDARYRLLYDIPANRPIEDITEEKIGDVVGTSFTDPALWQAVAAENPSAFKKLAEDISRFIQKVLNALLGKHSLGAERFVSDMKAAQAAIAKVLAEYATKPAAAPAAAPAFEAAEAKRRSELEAGHFALEAQSQPKPVGVQGDLLGAQGLTVTQRPSGAAAVKLEGPKPGTEGKPQGTLFSRKQELGGFKVGDKVQWNTVVGSRGSVELAGLTAGVVEKIGDKRILVRHEGGDTKWLDPREVQSRDWLTLDEERGEAKPSSKQNIRYSTKQVGEAVLDASDALMDYAVAGVDPENIGRYLDRVEAMLHDVAVNGSKVSDALKAYGFRDVPGNVASKLGRLAAAASSDYVPETRLYERQEALKPKFRDVGRAWLEAGKDVKLFQLPSTKEQDPTAIAEAMSTPGREIEGAHAGGADTVLFKNDQGHVLVIADPAGERDSYGAAQDWMILSPGAHSSGKMQGGGSQLYQAALAYIHNNGYRMVPDNNLSLINETRVTSNMLSSALRFQTTDHLLPDPDQKLPGWASHDTEYNIGSLALREMLNVERDFPVTTNWTFDWKSGEIKDGKTTLEPARIREILSRDDPQFGRGIGETTAARSVFTRSILERGATQRASTGEDLRRVLDKGSLDAVLYSRRQKPPPAPKWYSELEQALAKIPQPKAPVAQWQGIIKSLKGVKADEIEWSGILDWLKDQQGAVPKQAILDYLAQNGVQVEETVLGKETGDEAAATSERDALVVELDSLGYSMVTEPDTQTGESVLAGIDHRNPGVEVDDFVPFTQGRGFTPEGGSFVPSERVMEIGRRLAALEGDLPTQDGSDTRYSTYALPGGKNYRELLLTLPQRLLDAKVEQRDVAQKRARFQQLVDFEDGRLAQRRELTDAERSERDRLVEELAAYPNPWLMAHTGTGFRSDHFGEPNILAHVRFNERTDADGKRVLFLEELQSDWAQKGKRKGFKTTNEAPLYGDASPFTTWAHEQGLSGNEASEIWSKKSGPKWEQYQADYKRRSATVPAAPFVGKTEAWVSLALKRMIRYAAENGFDRVAWATGEQQSERYSLRKSVSAISWTTEAGLKDVVVQLIGRTGHDAMLVLSLDANGVVKSASQRGLTGKPLGDVLGKAVAEKIAGANEGSLKGEGLKIGGEGMVAFYDDVLPKIATRVLEKLGGGRLTTIEIPYNEKPQDTTGQGLGMRAAAAIEQKLFPLKKEVYKQRGFDITPALAEAALGTGMPMFSSKQVLDQATKAADEKGPDFDILGDISKFSKAFVHPRTIAAFDSDFAPSYVTATKQFEFRDQLAAQITDEMKAYRDLPSKLRARVDAVLELGRLEGKIYGTGNNPITVKNAGMAEAGLSKPGEEITLDDTEKAAYWSVRRAMNKALDMFRDELVLEHGLDPTKVKDAQGVLDAIPAGAPPFEKNALKRLADIVEEIQQSRRRGYIPFTRFGEFGIAVTDKEGKTIRFETVEAPGVDVKSIRARRAVLKRWRELKERYADTMYEVRRPMQMVTPAGTPQINIPALDQLARVARVDPNTWNDVQAQLADAMKKKGFRKHFLGSDNVPGYSTDFERALADYTIGLAGYLARRRYAQQWDQAIGAIPSMKPELTKYAEKYRQYVNTPAEEFQALRQAAFVYYIAGVPATAFVNLTQVPLISMPYMLQFTDAARVSMHFTRAYVDTQRMLQITHFPLKPDEVFAPAKAPEDVRAALQKSWEEGFFVPLSTYEMMGRAYNRHKTLRRASRITRDAVDVVASMFTVAERVNRLSTYIAAYRIAKLKGMRDKILSVLSDNALVPLTLANLPAEEFPQRFAEWVVDETHFRMGKVNRPAAARGWGSPITQFKGFSWQTIELYARLASLHGTEGRIAFMTMMLGLLLTAGWWGLPFADNLRTLIEWFLKKLNDEDIDLKLKFREFVAELTGSARIAEIMSYGGFRFFDASPELSSRIGQGQILPNPLDPASLLGVPYDLLAKRTGQAVNWWQRDEKVLAAAQMSPNFLKNWFEAYAMKEGGVRSQTYGNKILHEKEIDKIDVALKAAGFRSRKIAEMTEAEFTKNRATHALDEMKKTFTYRLATAEARLVKTRDAGDLKAVAAIEKRIDETHKEIEQWNKGKPDHEQILIRPQTVKKAARREILGPEGKEKQAPRQMRERRGAIEELYNQPLQRRPAD